MYQNSNVYCSQTMIKTGCLALFRLAQSCAFYVKLESSCCRIKCAFQPGSIDRSLDSIDRISGRIFFLLTFPTQPQLIKMCRVLCFALSIKGKPQPRFCGCFIYCVCESLVRSRSGLSRYCKTSILSQWIQVYLEDSQIKSFPGFYPCGFLGHYIIVSFIFPLLCII